jgi:hypothetical protein
MKKIIIIFVISLVTGCSSSPYTDSATYAANSNPDIHLANKNWKAAFTALANKLHHDIPNSQSDAKKIAEEYPELVAYSQYLFSAENMKFTSNNAGEILYLNFRLKAFCSINSQEDCDTTTSNFNNAVSRIRKDATIPKAIFDQLTKSEQESLNLKYDFQFIVDSEIGIVTDRQIRNLSTPGSNFGAELGGAVGTAAYVSNATPSNYSLKSDIGNTLLGALVGAMLLNQQPVQRYQIRYTIKLRNGELSQVDQISGSPLGEGVGSCLTASNAGPVESILCTMTVSDFRLKYGDDLKGKSNF